MVNEPGPSRDHSADPERRRRVLRTVAILVAVAGSIYGYFIAKGVFGI